MFRIKICGTTTVDDATAVVRAGADAIGLNFFPRSPRCISNDAARQIIATLPSGMVKVGLFVNAAASDVCRLYDELRLDLIQLHGDEPPEYLTELGGRPIMRAFRVKPGDWSIFRREDASSLETVARKHGPVPFESGLCNSSGLGMAIEYLAQCRESGVLPQLVMIDSVAAGVYGGSGKTADWSAAKEFASQPGLPPLVLAGGLTPYNVADAIRTVHPAAVDVASGVESSPGRKESAAIEAFVRAARAAF